MCPFNTSVPHATRSAMAAANVVKIASYNKSVYDGMTPFTPCKKKDRKKIRSVLDYNRNDFLEAELVMPVYILITVLVQRSNNELLLRQITKGGCWYSVIDTYSQTEWCSIQFCTER